MTTNDPFEQENADIQARYTRLMSDPLVSGEDIRAFIFGEDGFQYFLCNNPTETALYRLRALFLLPAVVDDWIMYGALLWLDFLDPMEPYIAGFSNAHVEARLFMQFAFALNAVFSLVLADEDVVETDDFQQAHLVYFDEFSGAPAKYPLEPLAYNEAIRLMPLVECLHTTRWSFSARLQFFTATDDRFLTLAKLALTYADPQASFDEFMEPLLLTSKSPKSRL